jgi:hypothetical protein
MNWRILASSCFKHLQQNNEEVRISLHAIGESRNIDLIRLRGDVKGTSITALVDSGSTHTFVDPKGWFLSD